MCTHSIGRNGTHPTINMDALNACALIQFMLSSHKLRYLLFGGRRAARVARALRRDAAKK